MKKLISYVLSPIFLFLFFFFLCIFHPIQWVCHKAFGYRAHKFSVDVLNFFLYHCQFALLNSTTFENKQTLPTDAPIIFVGNHQSMYDIPGLIWNLRKYHPKFISKVELTKGIPSISYNLKVGGGANIDRKDSKQAVAEIAALAERMEENNWGAIIFPEGTRSKDGKIKPFQVGGVATLLKNAPSAVIVPIAIENSWKVVRFGSFPLGICLALKWTVLPIVERINKLPEEIVLAAENSIRIQLNQVI